MIYTKEGLKNILNNFLEDENTFAPGRTNDDMVDTMCVCFALDEDWDEFFNMWLFKHTEVINNESYIHGFSTLQEIPRIEEHHERVSAWLDNKWMNEHYQRGEDNIMLFAINC